MVGITITFADDTDFERVALAFKTHFYPLDDPDDLDSETIIKEQLVLCLRDNTVAVEWVNTEQEAAHAALASDIDAITIT